jgi:hypothetical protein
MARLDCWRSPHYFIYLFVKLFHSYGRLRTEQALAQGCSGTCHHIRNVVLLVRIQVSAFCQERCVAHLTELMPPRHTYTNSSNYLIDLLANRRKPNYPGLCSDVLDLPLPFLASTNSSCGDLQLERIMHTLMVWRDGRSAVLYDLGRHPLYLKVPRPGF